MSDQDWAYKCGLVLGVVEVNGNRNTTEFTAIQSPGFSALVKLGGTGDSGCLAGYELGRPWQ